MILDWDFTWKYISRYTLLRSRWDHTQVKWALGSIIMNKANGSDGIPAELFQILKDDAVKVLHSICQQIWKTQQWPQDWKRSVFILIPKKGNVKECSNYRTIAFISQWHPTPVLLPGKSHGRSLQRVGHDWSDLAAAAAAVLPGEWKETMTVKVLY